MVEKEPLKNQELVCPVEEIGNSLSFDLAEIEPLLEYLHSKKRTAEAITFPRGTVTANQTLDCCKQALGPAGADLITTALKGNHQVSEKFRRGVREILETKKVPMLIGSIDFRQLPKDVYKRQARARPADSPRRLR